MVQERIGLTSCQDLGGHVRPERMWHCYLTRYIQILVTYNDVQWLFYFIKAIALNPLVRNVPSPQIQGLSIRVFTQFTQKLIQCFVINTFVRFDWYTAHIWFHSFLQLLACRAGNLVMLR